MLPSSFRYDQEKVQSSPSDKMSEIMAAVDELDRKIANTVYLKAKAIIRAGELIDLLDSEVERYILYAFYIDKQIVDTIADSLGYSVKHVYRLKNRAIIVIANKEETNATKCDRMRLDETV